jgi:hypothetical protein
MNCLALHAEMYRLVMVKLAAVAWERLRDVILTDARQTAWKTPIVCQGKRPLPGLENAHAVYSHRSRGGLSVRKRASEKREAFEAEGLDFGRAQGCACPFRTLSPPLLRREKQLLDSHRLRQVSGLIHIVALCYGYVVSEQLHRYSCKDRIDVPWHLGQRQIVQADFFQSLVCASS